MSEPKINTHGVVCDFGKHKGTLYTRLPVSYLTWMVGSNHSRAELAVAELARRGTTTPDLDVSGHALDRVSLYCLEIWKSTSREKEGISSWLHRIAREALTANNTDSKGRHAYLGMKLVFELEHRWPVLKTVFNDCPQQHENRIS